MIDNKLKQCTIAVDAMGGDYAPKHEILGAVAAMKEDKNFNLILVGDKEKILKCAREENINLDEELILHTSQIIDMHDKPTEAIKTKKDSSLVVGAKLVREKKAHAFISAGNTGAMMAASTLIIGRIKNVGRPTIGAPFPSVKNKTCMVFDAGASVDSKPSHLFEYAILGTIFSKEIYGIENPSVGLLSVGEEETKGSELTFAAHKLLKESKLNYYGNVEGKDILKGTVDIVLCDGFVGNVILKFGESVFSFIKTRIKEYAGKGIINSLKALVVKGVLKATLSDMNYETHGGVPLLGIDGISIIGHGVSSPLAIKNMILRAKEMYDKNLIKKFEEALDAYSIAK